MDRSSTLKGIPLQPYPPRVEKSTRSRSPVAWEIGWGKGEVPRGPDLAADRGRTGILPSVQLTSCRPQPEQERGGNLRTPVRQPDPLLRRVCPDRVPGFEAEGG